MIVAREGAEPLRQARRVSAPGDAAVPGDHDRAAAIEPDRALRPDDGGIVAEGQHRAADHPPASRHVHGATRSSMRNRKIRSTFASAVACSVSASLPIPSLEGGEDRILRCPLHREDEREPEALAVPGVEIVEPGEFGGGEPVEPRAGLLPPRLLRDVAHDRRAARQIGVRAQQRELRLPQRGAHRCRRTRRRAPRDRRTAARRRRSRRPTATPPRHRRSGRRTPRHRARSRHRSIKGSSPHCSGPRGLFLPLLYGAPIDRGFITALLASGASFPGRQAHRGCAASQAPRRERSASVMPVSFPSGMVCVRTACRSIRSA